MTVNEHDAYADGPTAEARASARREVAKTLDSTTTRELTYADIAAAATMGMLLKPEEWCVLLDVKIMDPDGWRGAEDPPWEQPIGWSEFEQRCSTSTAQYRGGLFMEVSKLYHRLYDGQETSTPAQDTPGGSNDAQGPSQGREEGVDADSHVAFRGLYPRNRSKVAIARAQDAARRGWTSRYVQYLVAELLAHHVDEVSREEIAEMVGGDRPMVRFAVNDLVSMGVVELEDGRVTVLDEGLLFNVVPTAEEARRFLDMLADEDREAVLAMLGWKRYRGER